MRRRPSPRVNEADQDRAYRLFLGREPANRAFFATKVNSPRELIELCLSSDKVRSDVVRFSVHRRPCMFNRAGRPERDDLGWLVRVVPLPSVVLNELARAPDWRAFYAVLFRMPEFGFALAALGDPANVSRLISALGPPLTMRWPDGWASEPGPLVGNFDEFDRGVARGWLWNPDEPNQPARVEFVVEGEVVHSAYPSCIRPDVEASGRGTGFAGFETQLPLHLIGSELVVGTRLAGSNRELADPLRRLELPPYLFRWQIRRQRVQGRFLGWLRRRLDVASSGWMLRFVLPLTVADANEFRRTMAGIAAQWCSRWQLVCIARPETPDTLMKLLAEVCEAECRAKLLVNRNGGDDLAWFLSEAPATDCTIIAPITSGDDLEPDTVHRILQAAATGADFIYADEIVTLDGLLDAILPFRRSPFEREWRVAHPRNSNIVGIEATFARRLLADLRNCEQNTLFIKAGERASLIVHVLGLFRWRRAVDEDGRTRLRQIRENRIATTGMESSQAASSHLRFSLQGDPPREIVLGSGGLAPMTSTVTPTAITVSAYAEYLRLRDETLRLQSAAISAHIELIRANVRFAVRISDGDPTAQASTYESLKRQLLPNWTILDETEPKAWSPDSGTFLVWLQAGDLLHSLALYWLAARAAEQPSAILIYADHDEFAPGFGRTRPSLKPDWSPDLLESRDYIGAAFCVRLSSALPHLAMSFGSYDLLLRVTDDEHRVEHVREVVLHRPTAPGETAALSAIQADEMEALKARLSRTRRTGTVAPTSAGSRVFKISHELGVRPRISVILALASRDMPIDDRGAYGTASASIIAAFQAAPALETIVVVDALNRDRPALQPRSGVVPLEYGLERPSLAAMINLGAEQASGEFLLILDGPYRPLASDDIFRLTRQFAKAHVGSVGARVLHRGAGVALDGMTLESGFPMRRSSRIDDECDEPIRNVAAVMSPLMTSRQLFRLVGGYAEEGLSGWCHLEYCFRCRQAGKMIVTVPECRFEDWRPSLPENQPDILPLRDMADRCPRFTSDDPYRTSLS